jgi:hypothetical protein
LAPRTGYALITGRTMQIVNCPEEIPSIDIPTVVVATWPQLHVLRPRPALQHVVDQAPMGVIVGNSEQDLRQRALVSAALVYRSSVSQPLPPLPANAIVGQAGIEEANRFFDRTSGPESDPQAVCEVLQGPSSILGFLGHCDGVDARLSRDAILSARVDPLTLDLEQRPANCDVTGYCHRHLTRVDAVSSVGLISPRVIAARTVLMMSCYVARPADCSVHPTHGLLSQLLGSPRMAGAPRPGG